MLKQSNRISHPLYIFYIAGSTVFWSHAINTHTKTSVTHVSLMLQPAIFWNDIQYIVYYCMWTKLLANQYTREHGLFVNSHQLLLAK